MDRIKRLKVSLIVTVLLCLVPIIFGIVLRDKLPDMMPTHFDMNNNVNGYMKKGTAVVLLPAVIAAVEVICLVATVIDPRKSAISDKALTVVLWAMPALPTIKRRKATEQGKRTGPDSFWGGSFFLNAAGK